MEILDYIFKRRSIRSYTDKKVSRETLTDLLKAGMAAPSACNNRPWEFVVIDDEAMMDKMREINPYGRYNATAAIVVCSNEEIGSSKACGDYWVVDCAAATENILIAAAGMGLGTVWLGVYPMQERVKSINELLGMPDHVTTFSVILVGYPAEQKEPRTQYEEKRVHWQRY